MRMRTTLVVVVLAAVIVATGIGVYFIVRPATASQDSSAQQLTTVVRQGTVSSTVTASGSIQPVRTVDASFGVSGTVATVDVELGETVTAGQKLGTLDTTDLRKAVTSAYNNLSDAKADLAAAQTALSEAKAAAASGGSDSSTGGPGDSSGGGSNAQSVSSATAQVTAAKEKVSSATDAASQAESNLAEATLTAPIAGLVIAVGEVGDSGSGTGGGGSSGSGTSGFVTIADVSSMIVTANIAEADIASVKTGQKAEISFPALSGVTAAAKVTTIAPTATSSNSVVSYATTVTLDSIPDGLRLGQTADVTITTESSADDALYVPSAAITTGNDGTSTVKVVGNDGSTTTVPVTLGVVGDQGTEITSGLEAGETVVLGTVSSSTTTGDQQQGGRFSGPAGSFGGGFGGGGAGFTFPGGNR